MHRQLRDALRDAEGTSHFVVAVNIDIRGFSSFFSDSSQAAAFLSSAYARVLDYYFAELSFFKPTGDGLLLVRNVTRDTLTETVRTTVASALQLEQDFRGITDSDPLINFPTPESVGIGIARGTATRLRSGALTLDYSGRPLNLASRLMDLARPRGVVFDQSLDPQLLDAAEFERFRRESVYLKGIADTEALTAYVTEQVEVPAANRRPFGAEIFREEPVVLTLDKIKRSGREFLHALQHRPLTPDALRVDVVFPAVNPNGNRSRTSSTTIPAFAGARFHDNFGAPCVAVDYPLLITFLEKVGVKGPWDVTLLVSYPIPLQKPATGHSDSDPAS